jgi:hypothetical protein
LSREKEYNIQGRKLHATYKQNSNGEGEALPGTSSEKPGFQVGAATPACNFLADVLTSDGSRGCVSIEPLKADD